jgi:hypothetical protein
MLAASGRSCAPSGGGAALGPRRPPGWGMGPARRALRTEQMNRHRANHLSRGRAHWLLSLLRRVFAPVHGAATDLLEERHRLIEDLFEHFAEVSYEEKLQVFDALASVLAAQDAVERDVFYPACAKALGRGEDAVAEMLVDLGFVRFMLQRAVEHRGEPDFEAYVGALENAVRQHVRKETRRLFPELNREVPGDELELLRRAMEVRMLEPLERPPAAAVDVGHDASREAGRRDAIGGRRLWLVK